MAEAVLKLNFLLAGGMNGTTCSDRECENGGICSEPYPGDTYCTCADGYNGESCQHGPGVCAYRPLSELPFSMCVHVCVHRCVHRCVYVCMCVYVCAYRCACVHVHRCVHRCVHVYVCI